MKTSWVRDHLNATVQTRAIWNDAGGQCVAYVDGPENRVPTCVTCDTEKRAKATAEAFLMEAYPTVYIAVEAKTQRPKVTRMVVHGTKARA